MIETGKIYGCFDDGQITPSRYYEVFVIRYRKIEELPEEVQNVLEEVTEDFYYLYEQNPLEVLEAVSYEADVPQFMYFLPTGEDKYFGVGLIYYNYETEKLETDSMWCSGRLDVDGTLKQIAFN